MKLYLESLRRMMLIGFTLMLVAMVATVVVGLQITDISDQYPAPIESCLHFASALMGYVFLGGAALAYNGFSFLTRRADSDFYHSIPVKRSKLYLSIVLAGATWIAATVLMSIIASTVTHLARGLAFVPAYPFINAAFYFVATMMVFAAAAVAISSMGNWFLTVIATVLVLGLPRFTSYLMARTIMDFGGGLLNWKDLGILTNPAFNSATGIVTLLLRQGSVSESLMRLDGVAYSLGIAVAELGLGCWLFVRRPSETAGRGAQNKLMQSIFACAFAMPMAAYVVFEYVIKSRMYSTTLLILILLSLGCYIVFQAASVKNVRRVMCSLPWYLCPVALSFGLAFMAQGIARAKAYRCPVAEEINSVEFLGEAYGLDRKDYRSILYNDISFTDAENIRLVADTLDRNVAQLKLQHSNDYYGEPYNEKSYYQTVRIHTAKGTIVRNLCFEDREKDKAVQTANAAFSAACLAFPPEESISYVSSGFHFFLSDQEFLTLYRTFQKEYTQDPVRSGSNSYVQDERTNTGVVLTDFFVGGYVGTQRYMDTYRITADMKETAALWMEIANRHSDALGYIDLIDELNAQPEPQGHNWRSFNMQIAVVNAPYTDQRGLTSTLQYLNYYNYVSTYESGGYEETAYVPHELAEELAELLSKGAPCNDPDAMYLIVTWGSSSRGASRFCFNPTYLCFAPEDEARVREIVKQWLDAQDAAEIYY